jgi:hypothetical protein
VYDADSNGTNGSDLLLFSINKGFAAYSINSTLKELKQFISAGYPVITLQDLSRESTLGHFRVAVGYDDEKRTITLRDSNTSSYVVLPYSEFDYLWDKRGRWALLVMPREKDQFKNSLGRSNTVLHLDLAQAYLRQRDYGRAESESRQALRIEPANDYARGLLEKSKAGSVRKT